MIMLILKYWNSLSGNLNLTYLQHTCFDFIRSSFVIFHAVGVAFFCGSRFHDYHSLKKYRTEIKPDFLVRRELSLMYQKSKEEFYGSFSRFSITNGVGFQTKSQEKATKIFKVTVKQFVRNSMTQLIKLLRVFTVLSNDMLQTRK